MAPDDDRTQTYVPLTKGTMVSHYRIIEKIGAGGMGEVYLAEDTELNRKVAFKFLPLHLCQDADCRARFKREAQAAAKLDHPNIVSVFEVGEFQGRPFFSMQHVEGQSLKEVIAGKAMPLDRIFEIGIQVCEGLQAAHEKGIFHRDIKPSNILMDLHGRARIVDFGLASVMGSDHLTKTGSTLGTIGYMSPEQVRGDKVDHRTDLFSFGVVLYEMITGHAPFKRETEAATLHAIAYEEPAPLPEDLSIVTDGIKNVIARSLNKNPEQRYATAHEMLLSLEQQHESLKPISTQSPRGHAWSHIIIRPVFLIPVILILAGIAYLSYRSIQHNAMVRWAREEALPAVDSLANESRWESAYFLAKTAEPYIRNDPMLIKLWPKFAERVSIRTNPSGAQIYLKEYAASDDRWMCLGRTPLDSVLFPSCYSYACVRVRIEKDGYLPLDLTVRANYFSDTLPIILFPVGSIPPEIAPVRAGKVILDATGDSASVDDFLIDKFETTNRDYKEFVDSGGYQRRQYWKFPVTNDGGVLSWEQSLARFVDATGRPGPATWEMGTYRDGEADYPVGGISWYEAAAYAEFRGKMLPSVYHWNRAANPRLSRFVVHESNFGGKGPAPVGNGISACGAYDMAGNVREWCFNQSGNGRCILGGGWNDRPYSFADLYAQPPLDRSQTNGVRCMKLRDSSEGQTHAYDSIVIPFRDYTCERPVPDLIYRQYLSFYAYDRTALQTRIESTDSSDNWVAQKVSFNAAYGGERMMVYLYLPREAEQPFQTVIYFPGSDDLYQRKSSAPELMWPGIEFIVQSGRAFVYPILKGTWERGTALTSDYPNETVLWRDHVIAWVKDFGRTIDYLGTRSDIDTTKLAYFGWSWGGAMGAVVPAVEQRLKVVVLNVAGLPPQKALPEVDAINFVSHITQPVLMLNGRYDYYFPYETCQLPMFSLLGTPTDRKRQVVYETSHFLPKNQLIREILNWLDTYLGKVQFRSEPNET